MKLLSGLTDDTKDILLNEFLEIKDKMYMQEGENIYYVYALYGKGSPFYIGKGKNLRCYDHLKNHQTNSLKDQYIRYLYEIDEPPVVFIIEDNLTEKEAFYIEKEHIEKYGRLIDNSGILTNIMPGDVRNIDKEKSRAGGLIHNIRGTRGGCFNKEWRENNNEYSREISSKAGKESWRLVSTYRKDEHEEWSRRGGKKTGKMVFWTNGKETTRSHQCPGKGWYRGNCNFNKNSIAHSKKPLWTNGKINKYSDTKPGDGFFNGKTQKHKGETIVNVFSNQIDESNIPDYYSYGYNTLREEE